MNYRFLLLKGPMTTEKKLFKYKNAVNQEQKRQSASYPHGISFTTTNSLNINDSQDISHIEKRTAHNALERQRREGLNTKFQELAHVLPSLQQIRRPSKSMIVTKSLEFVSNALARESQYKDQLKDLRKENEQLRRQASVASKRLKNLRRKSKLDDTFIERPDDASKQKTIVENTEKSQHHSPVESSTTTIITTTTKRPRDPYTTSDSSNSSNSNTTATKRQRVASVPFPQQRYHLQQQYHIDFNINQALPAHELSFASYHNMVYPPPPPPPPQSQVPSFSESGTPLVRSAPQYTYNGIHLMPGFVPEDSSDNNQELFWNEQKGHDHFVL
ncbi:hypothetical protein K501DRAFT_275681 [Backusella circina FSU 941]|nr:hypothetical protein K501DRAFT_275681 [Backusella circina FSU 941]